jgi:hypothetical protein
LEAGNNFLHVDVCKNEEGKDWISVKLDRSQIKTTGLEVNFNFK